MDLYASFPPLSADVAILVGVNEHQDALNLGDCVVAADAVKSTLE